MERGGFFKLLQLLLTGLSFALFLSACDRMEVEPETEKGLVLILDLRDLSVANGRQINTRVENITHLFLTIQTIDGEPTIVNNTSVEFSIVGEKLISKGIQLPMAEYKLTEVLVKDYTDHIVYAIPNESSTISNHISNALPFLFRIQSDGKQEVNLDVVSTRGHNPEDFGFPDTVVDFKDEVDCDGGIYQGNISISSQAQVNEIGSRCYSGIEGDLSIDVYSKIDLSPLLSLRFISGSLIIMESYYQSSYEVGNYLTSLNGLHNVEYIGTMDFSNLRSLTTLVGLEGLKEVGNVYITDNTKLRNLRGLGNLRKCGVLRVSTCDSFGGLTGLDNLEEATALQFNRNPFLHSLHGMPKLKSVGNLALWGNIRIRSLTGLFETAPLSIGDLWISHSDIKDLKGFLSEDIKVTNSLDLNSNNLLTSLEGLHISDEIRNISITRNESLTDIGALKDVRHIKRMLVIERNAKLESLDGLENLAQFGGDGLARIWINHNTLLKNYCPISDCVKNNQLDELKITENAYNPSLQDFIDGKCEI